MARKITGHTEWRGGRWQVQATGPDSKRDWYDLPASIAADQVELAKAVGQRVAAGIRRGDVVPTEREETVSEYAKRWLEDREARKLSTVADDRARLERYVLPRIGHLAMRQVTREELRALVADLDDKVRKASADGGRFSWKTAIHVWGNVTKLFKDAVKSKNPSLCVLETNPCTDVAGPDRGKSRRKQYLYPSEALAFLSSDDVPLLWRRLYAVTTYLYARPEEVEALEWSDVDLVHGTVSITKAVERSRNRALVKGAVKEPKTEKALRTVPIEPTLLPLLRAMHKEADGKGLLFPRVPSETEMSRKLRAYLTTAGVEREALFKSTAGSMAITWYHATRSTGITWEAVRGLDGTKLMRRAGHETFETTLGYIREAENLTAAFGRPFPPLPAGLLAESPRNRPIAQRIVEFAGNMVGATGFEPVTSTV